MSDEFFDQDLSQFEIEALVLRIIRYEPDWIYKICQDPGSIEKKNKFKEAIIVHNYFEDIGELQFVINNFKKLPRIDFFAQLLTRCHLFIDTDVVISIEIKNVNQKIRTLERLYNRIPPNNYFYEDNYNNSLNVIYGVELKDYYIVIQFYALLYVMCENDHLNIYQINKNVIVNNLNNNIGYIIICPSCKTRFVLPPNFTQLSNNINRSTYKVESFQKIRAIKSIPQLLTEQLISKNETNITEVIEDESVLGKIEERMIIPSKDLPKEIIERRSVIARKITKNFRPYKYERISFKGINLNTDKFRIILTEVIGGRYNSKSFYKQISLFKEIRENEINFSAEISTDFLCKLTRIAGKLVSFDDFCILLDNFSKWNSIYRNKISENVNAMFRNMILGLSRPGINYAINSGQDLLEKIDAFNAISEVDNVNLKTISKGALQDSLDSDISNSSRNTVINTIVQTCNGNDELRDFYLMIGNYYIVKDYSDHADEFFRKATDLKS